MTFDLFTQKSTLVPYAFVWEKAELVDYSDTIEVHGIKVGIYSKLNEYMEIYMYQRSLTFVQVTRISLISNSFCPEVNRQTAV